MSSKKNIIITGGAGFLGSHLCEYFLNKGHEVICMDNLITGSKDNISGIKSRKFQFVVLPSNYFIACSDLSYEQQFSL